MKCFSALKAEKALGYLCSLELPNNTVKQVIEEISKTRPQYIKGKTVS